jgi:hypothetical protein
MATQTSYSFTQKIDHPDVLTLAIQSSTIAPSLAYIEIPGDGTVLLWFSDVLSDEDQTTLTSLMASYVDALPNSTVQINKMYKDIQFGLDLIAQFGAANRSANLSTTQIIQISQQLAPLQSLLLSGSITTALAAIQNMTPSTLLPQATINSYVQQMQAYLAAENNS